MSDSLCMTQSKLPPCNENCLMAINVLYDREGVDTITCEYDGIHRTSMTACPHIKKKHNAKSPIKDSGERTQFSSGAVRDMHSGKGDMASIPWEAILRLSRHYENGAQKYDRWNFRKGINLSSYIDSACRHLAKYQCGCDDEDHLAAAAFNVLGAMLVEEIQPELIDLPMRAGKNRFQYFTESNQKEGEPNA